MTRVRRGSHAGVFAPRPAVHGILQRDATGTTTTRALTMNDTPDSRVDPGATDVGGPYARYVLFVLVYIFNFADRQTLSILAEDIKTSASRTPRSAFSTGRRLPSSTRSSVFHSGVSPTPGTTDASRLERARRLGEAVAEAT